ncbi:MAG: hemerythrin domain-containing protein [Candidatus Accumulibacter sp.]|uniref:hemerythrin domain-containing protein n=1 Tax=Accumulibacter sp. TaxID=2053492 RepID=UPI001A4027D6|nr:hemerythrin domain-containing protein [Accumulibacter sp.]MBL8394686.1 hemerythrin domain-containing protein [Accumulibacter sp.]
MQRSAALRALSREHHDALRLALHAGRAARSAAAEPIAAAAAQLRDALAGEIEAHFLREESDLLPGLAATGQSALVARTLDEHRRLRQCAASLLPPQAGTLLACAELLQAHVRFEERELFAAIERQLAAPAAPPLPA